jgi:hypothetical protein
MKLFEAIPIIQFVDSPGDYGGGIVCAMSAARAEYYLQEDGFLPECGDTMPNVPNVIASCVIDRNDDYPEDRREWALSIIPKLANCTVTPDVADQRAHFAITGWILPNVVSPGPRKYFDSHGRIGYDDWGMADYVLRAFNLRFGSSKQDWQDRKAMLDRVIIYLLEGVDVEAV